MSDLRYGKVKPTYGGKFLKSVGSFDSVLRVIVR